MTNIKRNYIRGWHNGRGGQWSRRVRWFEGRDHGFTSIRLDFEEWDRGSTRIHVNCYYDDSSKALSDFERFTDGEPARTFRNEQEEVA